SDFEIGDAGDANRNLLRLPRHLAAHLVDASDVGHRLARRLARALEEQPLPIARPSRPADFRAAAEEADAARVSVAAGARLAQPDVVGLILVRVERDPLAVRRPAQRLVFGIRRV